MLLSLIILYVITLIYLSIVERFRNYASIIAFQGWILLGIALLRLHSLGSNCRSSYSRRSYSRP